MEVHPPHEPVHSWRDALVHIGIMTIGLFIALSLEGLIEYAHHKHLVREARENIREELRENHEAAQKDITDLDKEGTRIGAGMKTLRTLQEHPHTHGSINFSWSYNELNDAAWRSARDTGALGYMPYKEVQSFTNLYGEQTRLADQMRQVQFHEAEIIAPMSAVKDGQSMPGSEFDAMLTDAGKTLMDLQILGQYLKSLDGEYVDELKKL